MDIEKVTDPVERRALEAQIAEFGKRHHQHFCVLPNGTFFRTGQTPHQLFLAPHPARYVKVTSNIAR